MDDSEVQRFTAAFEGSANAYGRTEIGARGRSGKVEGNSFVERAPLTPALLSKHLSGKSGLGAIPINDESLCKFGAIDIDQYDVDHKALVAKITRLKLPIILCRSKSGGGHAYVFMKDWVPAKIFREYLGEMASALGFHGSEIFPKQDTVLSERGDVGNFINLPYFDHEKTMRYAFNSDGEALTLSEFLDAVEVGRVTLSALESIDYGSEREVFTDGPPCVQNRLAEGPIADNRNITTFQMGVYAKLKYGSKWKSALEDMNQRYNSPPLEAKEIVELQKSLSKDKYHYQCKTEPNCSFCNKMVCKTRKFGIGNNEVPPAEISGMTIIMADPKLIFLDVHNCGRIEATMEDLQNQIRFQALCMDQLFFAPSRMKENDWLKIVNSLLAKATKVPVPEELTNRGQFRELIMAYTTSRIKAMAPEEMFLGKPWTEDGVTMFTLTGLMDFLAQRNFTAYNRPQIQERLTELNEGKNCHGIKSVRRTDGKRTTLRVWWVPAMQQDTLDMQDLSTNAGEVPF